MMPIIPESDRLSQMVENINYCVYSEIIKDHFGFIIKTVNKWWGDHSRMENDRMISDTTIFIKMMYDKYVQNRKNVRGVVKMKKWVKEAWL